MNHLEQLVAEWLQILRPLSSSSWSSSSRWFEGELDVVGINLVRNHLLHIEWGPSATRCPRQDRQPCSSGNA